MADTKDIKKTSLIRNAKGRLVSMANMDEIVTIAAEMEFQEAKEANALGFAAHCMTVCTLPHSKLVGPDGKTELREYVRHNGRTHLAIQAGPAVMPGTGISYGAYPRLGLIYLASRAKTNNTKEIELGASLSDFLKRLGIHVTGGKRGGITAANAQLFRLFTSSMMAWEDAGKGQLPWDSFDPFRLVERREIWWNPMAPDQPSLWKNTLVLTDRAFHELTQNAVPIDLRVPSETSVLLLSGPNTGGKTVSLKTVGLLSLLHQFGLPVPAAPETILPVWDGIWTDIGDHQSLDQALSTFSSHMKRMAEILTGSTAKSLVLLDEMASGTDPLEGGALGMSFLDHFLETGATVFGTTHHGALKNYAYTRPRVRNAAVEFDDASGKPTYKILPDVPGPSHALETAARVGIPDSLVARARTILEGGETDVASVIKTLRDKQLELKAREDEVAAKERGFREDCRKTDLLRLKLKQRETELKQSGLGEMNRFLSDSRKAFEKLVQDIREGELTTERIKEVRAFLASTGASLDDQKKALEAEELELSREESDPEPPVPAGTPVLGFAEGRDVYVEPGNRRGTLVRKAGKGKWVVALGAVKLTCEETKMRVVQTQTPGKKRVEVVHSTSFTPDAPPVFSLDLRGFRLEEAVLAVEKQVDRAVLAGLQEFTIVHGLGEGVLQKGVQDYLKGRRDVKKYFFSRPEEGGFGKTVVQL